MFKGFMVQARTGEGPAINSSTVASSGQRLVGRFLEGEGHKTLHCSSPDVRQTHNNNNNSNNNNNNTSSNIIQCSFDAPVFHRTLQRIRTVKTSITLRSCGWLLIQCLMNSPSCEQFHRNYQSHSSHTLTVLQLHGCGEFRHVLGDAGVTWKAAGKNTATTWQRTLHKAPW